MPADLIDGYDPDDFVTFTRHADYDILDIHFGEMESPDEWTEYDLGSLIPIRDELMEGDLRALYIVWLAGQGMMESYGEEDEEYDDDEEDDDEEESNEPGLSRLLVRELRELSRDTTRATPTTGERVTYATLLTESKTIRALLERERREQEEAAHLRHLQNIRDHQDDYWQQVDAAALLGTGGGYDEAVKLLVELREAADQFKETEQFQTRVRAWVRPHLRRPALVKRLQERKFTLPEA